MLSLPCSLSSRCVALRAQTFGATLAGATKFPGLRSEEMITVGQYTPVLRTYT